MSRESSNPYQPTADTGSYNDTVFPIAAISRLTMSLVLVAVALGTIGLAFAVFRDVAFQSDPYGRHHSTNVALMLVSSSLTLAGLIWLLSAFAVVKRNTRVGVWLAVAGFAAFCIGMSVGVPA